jgi:membrane-associated phospholipid phosphatase
MAAERWHALLKTRQGNDVNQPVPTSVLPRRWCPGGCMMGKKSSVLGVTRMSSTHATAPRLLTRRSLLSASLSAGALRVLNPGATHAAPRLAEDTVRAWRPWLLTAGNELRPAAPPPAGSDEHAEVLALQRQTPSPMLATIDRWDDPTVLLPWTQLALELIKVHQPNPVRAARALALLHVALFDTLVATEDARTTYPRPGPSSAGAVVPLGRTPVSSSSFPSEHAAVAMAAATVLASLFPDEPTAELQSLADEAALSRLIAGRAFRSDVTAGHSIGKAIGERAVARGKADGSDISWDGSGRPTDPGSWQPTPPGYVQQPAEPLAGSWRTWALTSGGQYRPAPPPSFQSPAWQAELGAVQEAVARRTPEQVAAVQFWAGGPGTVTPAGVWIEIAQDLIIRDGLVPLQAARVLALVSVAMADGFICCWDAKYTYWTARPITADPELDVLIPTPPFPSYTSGHATISTAAATVLGHLFPADASALTARADDAKQSRLWAGIHFPIDTEMGAVGGGMIGRLVVARARVDGAG